MSFFVSAERFIWYKRREFKYTNKILKETALKWANLSFQRIWLHFISTFIMQEKKNTSRLDWVARQDIVMVCLCCLLVPCVCRRSTSRCWASWCCNTSEGTRSPPERDVGDQCWVRRALLFIENYIAPSPRCPLSLPFLYWWFVTQLLNSPIFTCTTSLSPFFSAFIPF